MDENQASARTAEFALKAVSLFLIAAGLGVGGCIAATITQETITLLSGALVGILVAAPIAVFVTMTAMKRQQPQPPASSQPQAQLMTSEQWCEVRRELVTMQRREIYTPPPQQQIEWRTRND